MCIRDSALTKRGLPKSTPPHANKRVAARKAVMPSGSASTSPVQPLLGSRPAILVELSLYFPSDVEIGGIDAERVDEDGPGDHRGIVEMHLITPALHGSKHGQSEADIPLDLVLNDVGLPTS